ncbi:hypothetical protein [Actinoplanes philippinensis]|uniref:hypothetical protein n=1 Tax=Actinoplanes philippinensis TaxID=35752 RepID=UPI000B881C16|nr:hypothetical protein [Actinoplanes philippinensis]
MSTAGVYCSARVFWNSAALLPRDSGSITRSRMSATDAQSERRASTSAGSAAFSRYDAICPASAASVSAIVLSTCCMVGASRLVACWSSSVRLSMALRCGSP